MTSSCGAYCVCATHDYFLLEQFHIYDDVPLRSVYKSYEAYVALNLAESLQVFKHQAHKPQDSRWVSTA